MKKSKYLTNCLLELLTLERLSESTYRGISKNLVGERVFGGQILAQALIAASRDVYLPASSLHCYFYLPGNTNIPIDYQVSELISSNHISIKEVNAFQKNKNIFKGIFKFSPFKEEVKSHIKTPKFPDVDLFEDENYHKKYFYKKYPKQFPSSLLEPFVILSKPITIVDPIFPQRKNNKYIEYFKTHELISVDPQILHQAIATFYSDYNLLSPSLTLHGLTFLDKSLSIASLDHAIYFHAPLSTNEWILYDIHTTCTANQRGLNIGHMWQFGKLVCTTVQENLMRLNNN